MFKAPTCLSFYFMSPSRSSSTPGCSDAWGSDWTEPPTCACSIWTQGTQQSHLLLAAVERPCSFHACHSPRPAQPCISQQAWLTAEKAQPTGSMETYHRRTEYIWTRPMFAAACGASPNLPPRCLQVPAPQGTLSVSGCFSQGAEPQLACLVALP